MNAVGQRNPTPTKPTIDDVREFWDANPLWQGESQHEPGSRAFFEDHEAVVREDCFAGQLDERIFATIKEGGRVLDLGCGNGFWLIELARRGVDDLYGADLSPNSLSMAGKRCEIFGVEADLSIQNAEATDFDRNSFDHVNCQGVVHHTTSPYAAVREIHAILKPGGTCSLSVYYRNIIIRNWALLRLPSKIIHWLGGGLLGRGREAIFAQNDVATIVRHYDGEANPIGLAYDRTEFKQLIGPGFDIEEVYFHFFPARALPFRVPRSVHGFLDRRLPFMIYATLRKSAP
ncbi:MAG: class I SAM-dependent methyltransferase [Pseudomonadota bacterium]